MADGNLSGWSNPGKSWFLGIGINKYVEFTDLSNAVGDVQKILSILQNTYDIDADCVHTLFDEEANEENIIDKLDFLSKQVGDDDKLIIYYSGHGMVNNNIDVGYWIPHDAKKTSSARYILNSTVKDYVGGLSAKHILLISDSCFSGSMFMRGASRSTEVADELANLPSRWAICSGRNDEEVYDGDPGSHSPFAQSLINLLSNIKSDNINIGKVVNHVIEETAANYEQLPDGRPLFGVGHGGGQYIFRKKGTYAPAAAEDSKKERKQKSATRSTVSQLGHGTSQKKDSSSSDLKMVKIIAGTILGAFLIMAVLFWGIFSIGNDGNDVNEINQTTPAVSEPQELNPHDLPYKGYFNANQYYKLSNSVLGNKMSIDILNDGENDKPLLADTEQLSGQSWKLTEIGGGYYRMTTEWQGESQSLDVIKEDGVNKIRLLDSGNYTGQFWKFHRSEDNRYRITNFWLGDDFSLSYDHKNDRIRVILTESTKEENQLWIVR